MKETNRKKKTMQETITKYQSKFDRLMTSIEKDKSLKKMPGNATAGIVVQMIKSFKAMMEFIEIVGCDEIGDLNGDSLYNILDIVQMVNIVLGSMDPTEAQFASADMNSDGIVNILDIVSVINLILDN